MSGTGQVLVEWLLGITPSNRNLLNMTILPPPVGRNGALQQPPGRRGQSAWFGELEGRACPGIPSSAPGPRCREGSKDG